MRSLPSKPPSEGFLSFYFGLLQTAEMNNMGLSEELFMSVLILAGPHEFGLIQKLKGSGFEENCSFFPPLHGAGETAPSPTLKSKTREITMTFTAERSLPPWQSWCSITWSITGSWRRKTGTSLSSSTRSTAPTRPRRGEFTAQSAAVCHRLAGLRVQCDPLLR